MIDIPQRAKNEAQFSTLKAIDKKIVAAAVLLGLPNQEAFKLYHPEYLDARGSLNTSGKQASSHFWGYGKTKDYRESYEQTVAEFFGRGQTKRHVLSTDDIDGNRKERALASLLNQAMSMVEGGADLDADTLKTITEIFKKLNILKEEVEQEIRPIRVLPSRCGECRYKAFTESVVLNGEVLDMCVYCKCRRIAEEHDYRFNDGKDLLEIPEDMIKELESKNDVKLTDILSGKIEN